MIELDLQIFAKTASQMNAYRKSIAIKKYSMPGSSDNENNVSGSERKRTSFKEGRITRDSDISKNESYNIYKVNDKDDQNEVLYKEYAGSVLRDSISYDRIHYDRKQGVWISRKGNKYVIRKATKK